MDVATVSPSAAAMLKNLASASSGAHQASQPATTPTAPSIDKHVMETVEEMKSLQFQVRKMGYVEDCIVAPRKATKEEEELQFYRVKSITDETVKLVQCVDGHEGDEHEIALNEVSSNYKVYNGKITELLKGWDVTKHDPLSSAAWSGEASKAAVILAMRVTYKKYNNCTEHLELLQQPTMVKAKRNFKIGELQMSAASMKIERKEGKGFLQVGLNLWIAPQFTKPLDKYGNENKAPWVVPFWLISSASDDDEEPANMKLRHDHVDVIGWKVSVPVLQNTKALSIGDVLRWDKKDSFMEKGKPLKVANAGASKAGASKAGASKAAPPQKRARK